ncbi:MAG: hypothetical protein J6Y94_04510, partial [Bacteriovoracaceae bacterium]|nr:hypothetical protein [Bacteriovoracaceae bacterium]
MHWWYHVEQAINKGIGKILAVGWFLTPDFAKPLVGRIFRGLVWPWDKINEGLHKIINTCGKLRHLLPNLMAVIIGRLLLYPTQFLDWAQNLPRDKVSPKAVLGMAVQQIMKGLHALKSLGQRFVRYVGLGAIGSTAVVLMIAASGGYLIYSQFMPRFDQHYHFRKPASIIDVAEREDYYLLDQRQFTLKTVELPIWFEDVSKRRVMVADLTFATSNRSAIHFMESNELLVRDRISVSLEHIQPVFPLTDEGKQVL